MDRVTKLFKRLDKLNITKSSSVYISTLEGYYRLYLDNNNITVKEHIKAVEGNIIDFSSYSINDILPIIYRGHEPIFIIDDIEIEGEEI